MLAQQGKTVCIYYRCAEKEMEVDFLATEFVNRHVLIGPEIWHHFYTLIMTVKKSEMVPEIMFQYDGIESTVC